MRKTLIIIILIFWQATFSQSYKFDKMASYNVAAHFDGKSVDHDKAIYWNKTDLTYSMNLRSVDTKLLAFLYDYNLKKIHYFDVIQVADGDNFTLDFKYINTHELRKLLSDQVYDSKIISEDSLVKTAIITSYANGRKRKILHQSEVTLDKSGQNIFPFFQINDFDGGGALAKENNLPTGSVREIKVLESSSNSVWKLEYTKNVGFAIRIEKQVPYKPIYLN